MRVLDRVDISPSGNVPQALVSIIIHPHSTLSKGRDGVMQRLDPNFNFSVGIDV